MLHMGSVNLRQQALPSDWGTAWPNMTVLNLIGTNLRSTLPAEWGQPGSFLKLQQLLLSGNPDLTGEARVQTWFKHPTTAGSTTS